MKPPFPASLAFAPQTMAPALLVALAATSSGCLNDWAHTRKRTPDAATETDADSGSEAPEDGGAAADETADPASNADAAISCEGDACRGLRTLAFSSGTLWPPFDPAVRKYQLFLGLPDVYSTLTAEAARGGVTVDGAEITGTTQRVGPASLFERSTVRVRASGDGEDEGYEVELVRSLAVRAVLDGVSGAGGPTVGVEGDFYDYVFPKSGGLALRGTDLAVGSSTRSLVQLYTSASGVWSARADLDFLRGPGSPFVGAVRDYGTTVRFSERWLAVGEPRFDLDNTAPATGSIQVMARDDFSSIPAARSLHLGDARAVSDMFGYAIALHGDTLATNVDTTNAVRPGVLIYDLTQDDSTPPVRLEPQAGESSDRAMMFGLQLALNHEVLVVTAPAAQRYDGGTGAVIVYRREGTEFVREQRIEPPTDDPGLSFGWSISLDGNRLAVTGRQQCDCDCSGEATAFVYERQNGKWSLTGQATLPSFLSQSATTVPRRVGNYGVELSGSVLLVSSPTEGSGLFGVERARAIPADSRPTRLGTVYLFEEREGTWELTARLGPRAPQMFEIPPGGFGRAFVLADGWVAVASTSEGPAHERCETSVVAPEKGTITVFGPDCSLVPPGAPVPGCVATGAM